MDNLTPICAAFIQQNEAEVMGEILKGKNRVILNYHDLIRFNPELGDSFLESPKDIFEAMQYAIKDRYGKELNVRFYGLPKSHDSQWTYRCRDFHKLIMLTGTVSTLSQIYHKIRHATFECPSCGNLINIPQGISDKKLNEPTRCGCGRKGKFRLINQLDYDLMSMTLEESPDEAGGSILQKVSVLLREDMCDSKIKKLLRLGSKVNSWESIMLRRRSGF